MKVGTRLMSQACEGEVIVIRADGVTEVPSAGGVPMTSSRGGELRGEALGAGFALGKRYELVSEESGIRLDLLVTKGGTSTLTLNGRELILQVPKALPASD